MADNLEVVNGEASFAYNARGGMPWHRMGKQFDGTQSLEVMLEGANADYQVDKRAVWMQDERTGEFVEIPERFATSRINPFTGELQAFEVFKGRYATQQNRWTLEKALEVVGASNGDAVIDTVGVLGDGAQFFASIDLGTLIIDPLGIGDVIARNLLVWNSHNGTKSLTWANTDVRAVCENTCRLAERGAKSVFKARHTPNADVRVEEARKVLGFSLEWTEAFEAQAMELLAIPVPTLSKETDTVLDILWPVKDADTDRKKANRDAQVEKVYSVYGNNRNAGAVGLNGWGFYNAITEMLDHHGKGSDEKKILASMDEESSVSRTKVKAQKAILSLV